MNHVERLNRVLNFEPVDRLPMTESYWWWDKTLARWAREGLPANLLPASEGMANFNGHAAIRQHFGLDDHRCFWFRPLTLPVPECGPGPVRDMDDYRRLRPHLFPEQPYDVDRMREWAALQARGDAAVWVYFEGFFWFPRVLFGIEEHLYAFGDQPEVMHVINQDLVDYHLRQLDKLCSILTPDFLALAEDMSYNKGVMISKPMFEGFMAPYYRQLTPRLKERGIIPFLDSDGLIDELVPWMLDVGMEGIHPLERMAGVDVVALRHRYPTLKMMGGFDKRVMHQGEGVLRAEFERLLPVMKQGGYLQSVDHQTPPEVSLDDYRLYVRLQHEYARQAV